MAYADHVNEALWNERYDWLRKTEETEAGVWGSLFLSPHGTLLSYDVEIAFCAGAWLSVIVLAHAAIDATIRDMGSGDYESNSMKVFGEDEDLQWLRRLRNQLVHVSNPDSPKALPEEAENDVAAYQESLEPSARRAVALMFRNIYANKGT
ncbi:MAG: hypothetical protein ABIH80_06370 [Methanobacteriota archaeon]